MSAAPSPSTGSRPARARSTIRPTSWVSPGPHTTCGRTAITRRPSGSSRREREQLGRRPWSARSARGRARGRPGRRPRPPASGPTCATDGDETCTNRPTPAAARPRRAAAGCPPTLTASNSRERSGDRHLGRQVHDRLPVPHGAARTASGSVTDPGTSCAPATRDGLRCSVRTSCPSATSRSATARPSMPLAPVTRTRVTAAPAPPPAPARPTPRRGSGRSSSCAGRPSAAAPPRARRRRRCRPARRGPPRPAPGSATTGPCENTSGWTTTTTCCAPRGPTPTTAADTTASTVCARCSSPTGVRTPSAVTSTCASRPSIQSRPSSSRCPTSPVRCQPASRADACCVSQSRVVPLLDVRRGDEHLARDARALGRAHPVGSPSASSALSATRTPGDRPPDAHAVAGAGRAELVERHVGDDERLGHAVGRVRLGGGHQRRRGLEQVDADRGARREEQPDARERRRSSDPSAVRTTDAQRGGRREDDRGVDRADGLGQRARP